MEGFPIADSYPKGQDDYVGKQRRFAECGFDRVAQPSPRHVAMRRTCSLLLAADAEPLDDGRTARAVPPTAGDS